jgi:hypothetical protein
MLALDDSKSLVIDETGGRIGYPYGFSEYNDCYERCCVHISA